MDLFINEGFAEVSDNLKIKGQSKIRNGKLSSNIISYTERTKLKRNITKMLTVQRATETLHTDSL